MSKLDIPFMRMTLANGSSTVGETAGQYWGSAGRKLALFLDEFSKWEISQQDGSVKSTADITGCRIFVATPNGATNKYAKMALHKEGSIKVITLHWTLHPDKAKDCYLLNEDGSKTPLEAGQEAFEMWQKFRHAKAPPPLIGGVVRSPWYDDECIRRGSEQDVAQELDIDYRGSGYPFFSPYSIEKQRVKAHEPIAIGNLYKHGFDDIIFREELTGRIRLYEEPDFDEQYYIAADASKARNLDESSISVKNIRLNSTAAVVSGDYDDNQQAEDCVLLGEWYNRALVIPENSCGYGNSLTKGILARYKDVYIDPKRLKAGQVLAQDHGFLMTKQTRPEGLRYLEQDMNLNAMQIFDHPTLNQMDAFIINPKNNKAEAAPGEQDGLVICELMLSYVMRERPYKPRIKKRDSRRVNVAELKEQLNAGIQYGRD